MTIDTHIRAQRGYFRRYRQENLDEIRLRDAGEKRCRYRRGWANWLVAELIAYWYAEQHGLSQQTLDQILYSLPTSNQWMSFASDGLNRRSTGSHAKRTRSTG